MRRRCVLVGVWLGLILPWAPANTCAQGPAATVEPNVSEKAGKDLRAFRLTGASPRIDGRLDDEAWKLADGIDDFLQIEPDNMQLATERTLVQVAFDARYIYVAIRCYSANATGIRTSLGRRDNIPQSDRVYIDFDPRHDHQTAYIFQVNPSGVQGDFTLYDDTQTSYDYDGVWDVSTQVDESGWNAELRIPFSQMRFDIPPDRDSTWGFNVEREVSSTGEAARWVSTPRGVNGRVSRFGHLLFNERLAPPRRIELLPFVLAGVERNSTDQDRASAGGGFDLRVGLGSSTLSATINPDFGQVEADPAVLNLSVFETFFPEKRPFFLEDSRIFVLPYFQAPDFYSRRIGQTPGHLALKDNETLVRKPDLTTILGAAKLTGKASGWTYGGLAALTAREYGVVDVKTTAGDGTTTVTRNGRRLVEPATLYGVGRVQRDIFRASSNIGWITTAVVRERARDAFTGGPDFNIRWDGNVYSLSGHWLATRAPISGVMRTDFGGITNFGYDTKHVNVFAHFDHFGRNFRNADLGFLSSRANKNDLNVNAGLSQPDPNRIFRNVSGNVGFGRQWTDERLVFGKFAYFNLFGQFRNYWNFSVGGTHNSRRLNDLDTRGGPPVETPPGGFMYLNLSTDSRRRWGVSFNGNGYREASGGWNAFAGPTLRIQPSNRLQATISTNYTVARDVAQWIKNEDLDGDGGTENIFGRLRRHVLNVTGRATYSFSPVMTLEAYLQPFVAAGDYTDIRKLARPASFDFDAVTISENPDFNRKSLRGTLVLRWEYLPGSTLFVVWNLATSDTTRPGEFSPWRDLGTGFTAAGTHVFVAKLSYWFAP